MIEHNGEFGKRLDDSGWFVETVFGKARTSVIHPNSLHAKLHGRSDVKLQAVTDHPCILWLMTDGIQSVSEDGVIRLADSEFSLDQNALEVPGQIKSFDL